MAAHNARHAPPGRLVNDSRLERGHETRGRLQQGRQRRRQVAVAVPQQAPAAVDPAVEPHHQAVAHVGDAGQHPVRAQAVELVAVQDKEKTAVGGAMNRFARDHDVAELQIAEAAQVLVVVAGDDRDDRAGARRREHLAHDVGLDLRPVGCAAELPEVHDVADQVEIVAVVAVEEREQRVGGALTRAQVHVADPDRPAPYVAHRRTVWTRAGVRRPLRSSYRRVAAGSRDGHPQSAGARRRRSEASGSACARTR